MKGAELVVFPALSGALAASHRVQGFQARLLRQAEERRRAGQSLWARARSSLAGSTASLIGATYRHAYVEMLRAEPEAVAELYEDLFSGLARSYAVTLVAGSAYLRAGRRAGPACCATGLRCSGRTAEPWAAMTSWRSRPRTRAGDRGRCMACHCDTGGRLGILLGEERFIEAGRVLAYEGADILVTLASQ